MKKSITLLCAALASAGAVASTNVTVYGDDSYPPYSYVESGRVTGIYTVILEAVFSKMPDYNVTIKGVPWKRGLSEAEGSKIFALYPPYKRPEQRPYMEYDTPILDEKVVVVCQKSVLSSPKPNWPGDYMGMTIGINSGFAAGGDEFKAAVAAGKIKRSETKGTPKNLLKLIAGRIDCYINDSLSTQWELKKLQNEGKYDGQSVVEGAIISSEQGFLGFVTDGSSYPYKADFKAKYDKALKEMKQSGELDKIVKDFIQ
ncbi:substrate-binding periplasmic protein [Vibrio ostreicida]|uniref:ABC transporter substrate-binding protein n=1 Tax=Vibrio ostreicida TaxID=526588 RepID=A0ABT8BZC3_9VIBR|nr:ABC transporter substrate-binding protein [Vibrio ostreicida]MDN3611704.1 ABC transporter substrate-binding protein [Vibrio ostreicida]NPD10101.1 transporter substrate-binding domain-containing protein [Vibrio ostreicida]